MPWRAGASGLPGTSLPCVQDRHSFKLTELGQSDFWLQKLLQHVLKLRSLLSNSPKPTQCLLLLCGLPALRVHTFPSQGTSWYTSSTPSKSRLSCTVLAAFWVIAQRKPSTFLLWCCRLASGTWAQRAPRQFCLPPGTPVPLSTSGFRLGV